MPRPWIVDVSRWQEETNPAAMKAAGIVAIIARCTMGTIAIDEQYHRTQRLAREEDMIFGGYHLLWPENQSPELEADWYDSVAGETDLDVLDTELTHGLPKQNVVEQSYDWFKRSDRNRPKKRKMQYTGSWWWKVSHGSLEQEYDLIEAEYTATLPRGGVDNSRAPTGDPASLSAGWDDWMGWQWTSSGKPIGVQSNELDYIVFNGTMEELMVYIGKEGEPPPALEPDALLRLNAMEQWAISQGYIPPAS